MYCEKCGAEITGADKFCPKCGAAISTVQPTETAKTSVSQNEKKNDTEVKEYILKDKEIEQLSSAFVSKNEKYIASLGNEYIMNYLANKTMSRGFAFITDKRVYFKGSCLSGTGKMLIKTNEERTVDVKNITGSGFIHRRYFGVMLGILLPVLLLFIWIYSSINPSPYWINDLIEYANSANERVSKLKDIDAFIREFERGNYEKRESSIYFPNLKVSLKIVDFFPAYDDLEVILKSQDARYVIETAQKCELREAEAKRDQYKKQLVTQICPVLGYIIVLFLVLKKYLLKRKTLFRIEYAGGCIAFNVSFYAKAEIDDFQKQLRRAKDLAEESATKIAVTEPSVQPPTQNSVPDDLRKYAELLKEGLISQEEYDVMKKKILNL